MNLFEREVVERGLSDQWRYWQENFGFRVLPKRDLVIPQPDTSLISSMFEDLTPAENTLVNLGAFSAFLIRTPIADQFESDHESRRRWQQDLPPEQLPLFLLEQQHNQFRGCAFGALFWAKARLQSRLKNHGYYQQSKKIADGLEKIRDKVSPEYIDSQDYPGKLTVVQLVEDYSFEVIGVFC
jgi:hypothetical protein